MITLPLKIKKYLLLTGDIALLYLSLWLTLLIRYHPSYDLTTWQQHFWPFTVIFFFYLIIFYIDGLYEFDYSGGRLRLLGKVVRSIVIGSIISALFFYFGYSRLFTIKPQKVLLINVVIILILIYLWREMFSHFIKSPKLANNLLIIGSNSLVTEIIKEISKRPQMGFRVKAIISDDVNHSLATEKVYPTDKITDLNNICQQAKINIVVSATSPRENPTLLKGLFSCLPLEINFYDLTTFYEKITGKIPVQLIEQIWFLENLTQQEKKFYDFSKRIFDILLSLLLIIISLLFLPFIILTIKINSRGPILFRQKRMGKNGKEFMVIKFRTMIVGAEKNGAQWATKDDPRVTKVGKFLRRTRIDEIPQLINILRGEMSLIGPRPERPEFVEQLEKEIPFYKERLLIKPGLTGWAQVMGPTYGGSKEESLEKLQYDLFYIKNRSLALDLSITLKTIKTILSSKGQ